MSLNGTFMAVASSDMLAIVNQTEIPVTLSLAVRNRIS
jgi:hypothetical protein